MRLTSPYNDAIHLFCMEKLSVLQPHIGHTMSRTPSPPHIWMNYDEHSFYRSHATGGVFYLNIITIVIIIIMQTGLKTEVW